MLNNISLVMGSFDILHLGHIRLLKYARTLNKEVIALLMTDDFIKIIKGESRPINNFSDRKQQLIELGLVDSVIPIDQFDCSEYVRTIKPKHVVLGIDYKDIDCPSKVVCQQMGIEWCLFDSGYGLHTTDILNQGDHIMFKNWSDFLLETKLEDEQEIEDFFDFLSQLMENPNLKNYSPSISEIKQLYDGWLESKRYVKVVNTTLKTETQNIPINIICNKENIVISSHGKDIIYMDAMDSYDDETANVNGFIINLPRSYVEVEFEKENVE